MKHTIILLLFLFLFSTKINSQSFWAYTAGGVKEDEAMDICYDNSGHIISVGYFSGPIDFAPGVSLSSTGLGIPDIYISKSNSTGQVIWAKKAGGNGSDRALSVASDGSGNIYITGFYYGSAIFGSITLTSSSGSQDGFIAKLDANGNFLWAKSFGGNLAEWGNSITVDASGNPIVTGQFQGTSNFSGTNLTSMLNPITSFPSFDVFIAKYSNTGNLTWVKQGSAKFDDKGFDIVSDDQNNVYVCGQFSDTIQFQSTHYNNIMNAVFLIKYDSLGNESWFRRGAGLFSSANSLVLDGAHHIYITGDFQGTFTYFSPTGSSSFTGSYSNKTFLMKTDDNGNFIWGRADASNNYLSSKKVAVDSNRDPYIFGEFGCTHTEYSSAFGAGIFNSIGFQDFFITKYTNTGTRQWFKHYGGPRNDKAHGLLLSGVNQPIMAGSYEYQLNIPATNGLLNVLNVPFYYSNSGPPQPTTYCSATGNYMDYTSFKGNGYSELFIFKGFDLTRNPYDYYERSGSSCNLSFVGSCMTDRFNTIQCPDTIPICFKDSISANTHTQANYYNIVDIGPLYKYSWNGSAIDTLQHLFKSTSGYNTVKVSTIDGCYITYDTAYIQINPLPLPTITDNLGINVLHPPIADSITLCGPATLTLTAGSYGSSFQWVSISPFSVVDSSAIVNVSGTYSIIATNSFNCKDTNYIHVSIDSLLPLIVPKTPMDTINICEGNKSLLIICDSITNPLLNYPYTNCIPYTKKYPIVGNSLTFSTIPPPGLPLVHICDLSFYIQAPAASGMYTYTLAYVFNNACGTDTVFMSDSIYVRVKPSPMATLNVLGNMIVCPGDTAFITANLTAFNSTNITYTFSPNDTLNIIVPGPYDINTTLTDTTSGCTHLLSYHFIVQNKPNPFIILNPYNGVICPSDSIQLTISLAGATNYEWHGPGGIIPGNSQTIYVKNAGFYHCIVTDNTGCVFTTNSVEVKHYSTPYLISTPNSIICNNQSVVVNVITLDSTLITWNLPFSGGGATKVINTPGLYSCQVTMCNITSSLSINILGSNPTAAITSPTTSACPFDSIVLSGNPGMSSYNWLPGNYAGQTFTAHASGNYTLEVTDAYGCTSTPTVVSLTFTSSIAPPIITVNDTVCFGQNAVLSATSSAGYLVEWFPANSSGSLSGTGNSYIVPSVTSTSTYYAASVNAGGCHSIGVPVSAYIHNTSFTPLLVADTAVCNHDAIIITGPVIPGANYIWTSPSGATSTNNTLSISNATAADDGIYSLQTTGFGCTSPAGSITINVTSPVAPVISANDSVCENTPYTYAINPALINYSYNWQGPNSFSTTNDSLIILNTTIINSGTYSVTAEIDGCSSATSTLQLTVLVVPATPSISLNSPVCEGDTVFLNVNSNPNYSYQWLGANGFTSQDTSTFVIASNINYSGYYGVTATNFFCSSASAYDSVQVITYPVMISTPDTLACDNMPLVLTSQSSASTYTWSTGVNSSSVSITQSGTYWVKSQNGNCITTDSIHVSIITCPNMMINVFTPNGDGVNDLFRFSSPDISEVKCEIRNRWGEKVGEFEGKENGWNGDNMRNGKNCEQGTYFYAADIKMIDGGTKIIRGFLTLFR